MSDELTNDMIAEQVMGWSKVRGVGWRRDPLHIRHGHFRPLDDAADDFVVFDRAREWFETDDRRSCIFWHQLAKLCRSRSPHTSDDFRDIHLLHYYQVGDYSRAAMVASPE